MDEIQRLIEEYQLSGDKSPEAYERLLAAIVAADPSMGSVEQFKQSPLLAALIEKTGIVPPGSTEQEGGFAGRRGFPEGNLGIGGGLAGGFAGGLTDELAGIDAGIGSPLALGGTQSTGRPQPDFRNPDPFQRNVNQQFFEGPGNEADRRAGVFSNFVSNRFSDFSGPQQSLIGRNFSPLNAQFALSDPGTRGAFRDFIGTNPKAQSRSKFDDQLRNITPFINDTNAEQSRVDLFNQNDAGRLISGIVGSSVSPDQRRFVENAVDQRIRQFKDTNPQATTQEILREFIARGGTLRQ